MDTIIITVICAVLGSGGLFTLIQYLISRNDKKHDAIIELQKTITQLQTSVNRTDAEMALQSQALMSLARDRIIYLSKLYLKDGYISIDEHANLTNLAEAYKALGGNGLVKDYMESVDKLPRK